MFRQHSAPALTRNNGDKPLHEPMLTKILQHHGMVALGHTVLKYLSDILNIFLCCWISPLQLSMHHVTEMVRPQLEMEPRWLCKRLRNIRSLTIHMASRNRALQQVSLEIPYPPYVSPPPQPPPPLIHFCRFYSNAWHFSFSIVCFNMYFISKRESQMMYHLWYDVSGLIIIVV